MLAKRWSNVVQPTTQTLFTSKKKMVLVKGWPDVDQPTKTILTAKFFMLAQRWPYVVKPTQ